MHATSTDRNARPLALGLLVAAAAIAAPAAAAPAARVAYSAHVHTESWMPIRQADLEQAVVAKVVEELSQHGRLALTPLTKDASGHPVLDAVDLTLEVHVDIVGQAGNATVSLTLRPVRDTTLPSFAGAATASISKVPKSEMLRRILAAASQAGRRVREAMAPHLMAPAASPPPKPPRSLDRLLDWGKLTPPRPRLKGGAMRTLGNVRAARHARMKAAKALADAAFDDEATRKLLERVALTDPDPIIRYYAVKYLGPVSRKDPFTQQVLLTVLREDRDPKVKREALELSDDFLGLSPRRTVQSWVYLLTVKAAELYRYVAGGHNEGPGFGRVTKRLELFLDAPNLDLALTACLLEPEMDRRLLAKRQKACLELTEKLPPARRFAVLRPYVDRPLTALKDVIRDDRYTDCDNIVDRGEPLGRALHLMLHGPCHEVEPAQRIVARLIGESGQPTLTCGLVGLLGGSFPRPWLLDVYERVLETARDAPLRREAFEGIEALVRADLPPWGAPLVPRVKARLEQVLAQHKAWFGFPRGPSKRRDFVDKVPKSERWQVLVSHNTHRDVLRLLERLGEPRQRARIKARAPLSAPDGRPTLKAIAFLTRCVLESRPADLVADYRACDKAPEGKACQRYRERRHRSHVRECANDLQRIAMFFPSMRQQALAALAGLLAHPRHGDEEDRPFRGAARVAERTLEQVRGLIRDGYRPPEDRRRRRSRYRPRWLRSRIRKVCLPDP